MSSSIYSTIIFLNAMIYTKKYNNNNNNNNNNNKNDSRREKIRVILHAFESDVDNINNGLGYKLFT